MVFRQWGPTLWMWEEWGMVFDGTTNCQDVGLSFQQASSQLKSSDRLETPNQNFVLQPRPFEATPGDVTALWSGNLQGGGVNI